MITAYNFLIRNAKKRSYRNIAILLLTASLFFFLYLLFFTATGKLIVILSGLGTTAILGYLYSIAVKDAKIIFFKDHIHFGRTPARRIEWNELTNVVLKDQMLTIDFKNNKIFQEPVDEMQPPFSENDFNEFCRQQLNK